MATSLEIEQKKKVTQGAKRKYVDTDLTPASSTRAASKRAKLNIQAQLGVKPHSVTKSKSKDQTKTRTNAPKQKEHKKTPCARDEVEKIKDDFAEIEAEIESKEAPVNQVEEAEVKIVENEQECAKEKTEVEPEVKVTLPPEEDK